MIFVARADAVLIEVVPQLGDDVVRNHVCRGCILCIKTLAAAGAEPALLFVAIFFTRAGACRMVLCGEKIVDGRKAESKIPVPDYYEGELFMTVISNMRSLNNDRVKRLRVDVRFLRTRRESSGLDACGQDETIAILPLGQRLRCAICGACLETVYRIITVLQSMSFTAAITEVFNQNVRAHFFPFTSAVYCADTAAVSATSSRPSIRRFLSSRFFICVPPFP